MCVLASLDEETKQEKLKEQQEVLEKKERIAKAKEEAERKKQNANKENMRQVCSLSIREMILLVRVGLCKKNAFEFPFQRHMSSNN